MLNCHARYLTGFECLRTVDLLGRHSNRLYGRLYALCDPLVETEPLGLCPDGSSAVHFRRDAKRDFSAAGAVRWLAAFGAKGEIVIDAVSGKGAHFLHFLGSTFGIMHPSAA